MAQDSRSMDYICRNLLAGGETFTELNPSYHLESDFLCGFNRPQNFAESSKTYFLSSFVQHSNQRSTELISREIPVATLSRAIFTAGLLEFFGIRVGDVTWQLNNKMNFHNFLLATFLNKTQNKIISSSLIDRQP